MGLMQKLRQNMPAVVIGLIICFVLLIIFEWGDASQGNRVGPTNLAGVVNGEEISMIEFQRRVDNAAERQRQSDPEAEVDLDQIRELVWSQLVDETLVRQAAQRWGLTVSDDQLAENLLNEPPAVLRNMFTDSTGQFLRSEYVQFMTNPDRFMADRQIEGPQADQIREMLLEVQEQVRLTRIAQSVQAVVASMAIPAPVAIRTAFEAQNTKAWGEIAYLPADQISDGQVNVSDQEVRQYYDQNQDQYMRQPSREVAYTIFRLAPSASDSSVVQRRFQRVASALASENLSTAQRDSIFDEVVADMNLSRQYSGTRWLPMHEIDPALQSALQGAEEGAVIGPINTGDGRFMINVEGIRDSGETYVKAQHLLLRSEEENDSIRAAAAELASEARAGADFSELAREHSEDPGSAQSGGDLGYFSKGTMVPEFEEAAFGASEGEIVGPIKTDFGYHVLKINDVSNRAYQLRGINFDINISNRTRNLMRRDAQQVRKMLDDGISIDSAAARVSVPAMRTGAVETRNQPILGSRRLAQFAWNSEVGDVSDIIRLPDGSLVVATLEAINPRGPQPFDQVQEQIRSRLRIRKKVDQLDNLAKSVRSRLASAETFDASVVDSTVNIRPFEGLTLKAPLPDVGYEYPVTSAIFEMSPGEISQPIRGERGYYVVKLDSLARPSDQEFAASRKEFLSQELQRQRGQLFQAWMNEERETADIIVHWQ